MTTTDILAILCDCNPYAKVKMLGAWKPNGYDFADAESINSILFKNDSMIFKTSENSNPLTAVNLIAFIQAFKDLTIKVECRVKYYLTIADIDGVFVTNDAVYFCIEAKESTDEIPD